MLTSVPKEILASVASPVESPDEARELVRKLEKACAALKDCIGLAAPQIGISKAVAVIRDQETGVSINLVNPKIIETSDPFIHTEEGCMSSPGRRFNVPRFKTIKIENYSPWPIEDGIPNGADVWKMKGGRLVRQENCLRYDHERETWGGIITIAVQHEIDHLNGICIPWKEGSEEIIREKVQIKSVPIGQDFDKPNLGGDMFLPIKSIPSEKTGRNDPCPCGSGKKYKKCCLGVSNG